VNWKLVYRRGLGDERYMVVDGQMTLDSCLTHLQEQEDDARNVTLLRIEFPGEQHPVPIFPRPEDTPRDAARLAEEAALDPELDDEPENE